LIIVAVFSVLFALATWGVDEIFAKLWLDFLTGLKQSLLWQIILRSGMSLERSVVKRIR
jgi:high-affinity Fe2+/Pb2+ permease